MESGERKFDADALEQALAAVEKADIVEEKDTPRAVIMAMYPRLQEVMTSKGMSVRQLYQALKAQMDLPISEKTFSTYLQAAKKQIEGEKSRRGRKKGTKAASEVARDTAANNAEAAAGPATAGQGAEGEAEPEAGRCQMEEPEGSPTLSKPENSVTAGGITSTDQIDHREEPQADANGATKLADAKSRFEAHEAGLNDDMAELAAKYGKKE